MKKIFSTLTLVLCLVAMVSCGGKKDGKAAPQDPVKAKVEAFYEATLVAEENDDIEAMMKLEAEIEEYYNSLSQEEKEKFEEYVMELVEAEYDYDDEYVEEVVEDVYEYADDMAEDAYEYAEKMTDDAYEYADKAVEDAYKYAEKALENAHDFDW